MLVHARALEKLEREQRHELAKADQSGLAALRQAELTSEAELAKLFHTTVADVVKGSIERSRDSAKYVQTAATAIAGLYTGVLALVFSVTDNPLPVRGVYAAAFLGLAIALATAYLAFITKPRAPGLYPGGASLTDMQLQRTGYLTQWVNTTVHHRRYALRASVLALAVGVAFVPAPFLTSSRPPDVPDPPTAPSIPGAVAESVAADAAALFAAQVKAYNEANETRKLAIAAAASQATRAAAEDEEANDRARWLALVALVLVLAGPFAYGLAESAVARRSAADRRG